MDSRRKFLRDSVIIAATTAIPGSVLKANEKKIPKGEWNTEGGCEFKNTYVKNVFVTDKEFRNAKPSIVDAPAFQQA